MDDAVAIETWVHMPDEADWRSLVAVARLSRASDHLVSVDEHDFMYMGAALSVTGSLSIHLYKHRETRRYLNLDDGGHAYRYCGPVPGVAWDVMSGMYRLHRSLAAALVAVADFAAA